jgi:hypothetical protein
LTELDLSYNQLTRLPEGLGPLPLLTVLNLRGNQLTHLPDSFAYLAALTVLNLRGNQLTHLPESFGHLVALTEFDLSSNKLSELPDSFSYLPALTYLNLSYNQLTHLPDSFASLTALTMLSLDHNKFAQLPEGLGQLVALTYLDLTGNQLTRLPDSFANLLSSLNLNNEGSGFWFGHNPWLQRASLVQADSVSLECYLNTSFAQKGLLSPSSLVSLCAHTCKRHNLFIDAGSLELERFERALTRRWVDCTPLRFVTFRNQEIPVYIDLDVGVTATELEAIKQDMLAHAEDYYFFPPANLPNQ